MSKEKLEQLLPITFKDKVAPGWKNSVQGWYVEDATAGLYTLDVEHIPDSLVNAHNDLSSDETVASRYRVDVCPHNCSYCFNEENVVYSQFKSNEKIQTGSEQNITESMVENKAEDKSEIMPMDAKELNKLLTLKDTMKIIDQAVDIAKSEGHDFRSVKFLGPGELTINPQLFEIIEEYEKRGIMIGIFTKGAVLGSDELSTKYHNLSSKELVDKLASYKNVSLLFSFQSFKDELQDELVTTKNERETLGLKGYSSIRNNALVNIFNSSFYESGVTNRIGVVNAPIIPENIDESFEIYKFFVERGTPVAMTPSMVSGKGCGQLDRQKEQINENEWYDKLAELYARIYKFNVDIGVQTDAQIRAEGIASYVGAAPCNQTSTGLYIRANGVGQMCPGRFDKETVYGNVLETSLKEIWAASPNRLRGIEDPHNLVNNRCPAKDGRAFPEGFYEEVMLRYEELRSL